MKRLVAIGVLLFAQASWAAPIQVSYQGRLLKTDGSPEVGVVSMAFAFCDAATGPCSGAPQTIAVALSDGFYSVLLSVTPADLAAPRYLSVTLNNNELVPRQPFLSPTQTTPSGTSCANIHNTCSGCASGDYWIDVDGSGPQPPFQVYCDMVTDGGGWTFALGVVPTDGNIVDWTNLRFWIGPNEYGTFATRFIADYKSPAAALVLGSNVMVQVVSQGATGTIIGWKDWIMPTGHLNDFWTGPMNKQVTSAVISSSTASVYAWEPIIKNGVNLIANRIENPNGDLTRLGVTLKPFSAEDNEPGLGTGMNEGSMPKQYRHDDVQLQWNTSANLWCTTPTVAGTFTWLGTDSWCGSACGTCQQTGGPGYSPAWSYRLLVR